jgi:glycine betaine/proline transport system substrate-binding protein
MRSPRRWRSARARTCFSLPERCPLARCEGPGCGTVRFSDVGWTDITATTALSARLLEGLGYKPVTHILAIPVTYASMKNRQIDVYLGDWQPSMQEDRRPFLADGSIEVVRANLEGAKYTLAVPSVCRRGRGALLR